jgi:4-amino-4-deoxy-L-arabinose transferase-like glycosyltransferase
VSTAIGSEMPARRERRGRVLRLGDLGISLRSAFASVPRTGWACALVMLANGLAWSLITPPFQVPDENAHYAYVQQVVERGTVPRLVFPEARLSPAEDNTLAAVLFYQTVGESPDPVPMSQLQQDGVERVERASLSSRGSGDALSATNNPPLYYALEAIPYKLASGGSVLDRLAAMRMLSALMGAVTVLLVYLFLSELLPGRRWAWSAGALVVAFQPLFGFMSGGVNNDNLLYLTATGVLWALARTFRRGLTPANGALLGTFLGAGIVTKLTLLGFVPAVALGVLIALRRARGAERAAAWVGAVWAVGIAAAPFIAYLAFNHLVWKRGVIPGGVGSVAAAPGVPALKFDFREELSHVWQLYLPSIHMHDQFSYVPLWKTWFKGFFGRFGWLDYKFGYHFYLAALAVSLGTLTLALGEIVRRRRAFLRRVAEFAVYALALIGVCVEVGVQSYRLMIQSGGFAQFEQARYLLPMIGLYGAIAALAVRFGGRRFGPAIGALLVVLAIGHDISAQVITISRYYA